jgi:predicted N-acetyltransferase YhbS
MSRVWFLSELDVGDCRERGCVLLCLFAIIQSFFDRRRIFYFDSEELYMDITYRQLAQSEYERIKEIDASQFIKRAWREINGVRQLVEINWQDYDFPDGYETHLASLKGTFDCGGFAIGAFDGIKFIGFCSVNSQIFGSRFKYVLLDQIFISNEYRRKGIGKRLFFLAADETRLWGVERFYICAGSAEETIAFYMSLGCEEAKEVNTMLYENDTRDIQLEYNLRAPLKTVKIVATDSSPM